MDWLIAAYMHMYFFTSSVLIKFTLFGKCELHVYTSLGHVQLIDIICIGTSPYISLSSRLIGKLNYVYNLFILLIKTMA